jgi:hypothetical protein
MARRGQPVFAEIETFWRREIPGAIAKNTKLSQNAGRGNAYA